MKKIAAELTLAKIAKRVNASADEKAASIRQAGVKLSQNRSFEVNYPEDANQEPTVAVLGRDGSPWITLTQSDVMAMANAFHNDDAQGTNPNPNGPM